MPTFALEAEERKVLGKKVKTLRKQGKLPLVLYGHKKKSLSLETDASRFNKIYQEAGANNLVDLSVGKEKTKVLIHDIELDPVTDKIIHADLYAVNMDQKIKTEIPLKFVGRSKAVKDKEGNLITHKDALEVEVLPGDLVEEIEVDITPLKTFDDVIKIKDLNIPQTITVLLEKEEIVANVTPPRSEEELEALEEAVEEDVESVEVTTEKKEEEEEEVESGKETPEETEAAEAAPAPEETKPEEK